MHAFQGKTKLPWKKPWWNNDRFALSQNGVGQSTPGQPDRDTEHDRRDLAKETLDAGDVQSVKHVVQTDALRVRPCWAGHATCEDQSAENLNGSGGVNTRTA